MELALLRDSIAHEWGRPNDFALKKRIEKHIISARASIIQRRYDNTKIFPESLLITIKIDELEKDKSSECGCSCKFELFKRTPYALPKPLIVKDESYFVYVGATGFLNGFGYIPSNDLDGIPRRRFSSNQVFYTIVNDFIYIVGLENSKPINELVVKYLPENPLLLKGLGKCEGSCFKDGEFYIEESLVEGIVSLLQNRMPKILTETSHEIKIDD